MALHTLSVEQSSTIPAVAVVAPTGNMDMVQTTVVWVVADIQALVPITELPPPITVVVVALAVTLIQVRAVQDIKVSLL
jgi:hypothetical protein